MSESVTFNGASYVIPDVGEAGWGQNLTNYFVAIPQGCYQLSGGTQPLTADLSFGSNFGLLAKYFKSVSANIAAAGAVRLAVADTIDWRNNANNGNLALAVNNSDQLTFNGSVLSTLAIPIPIASGGTNSTTGLANGKLIQSLAGAIVESAVGISSTTITASLTGAASLNLLLAGGTMSGNIAMASNKVTGLAAATTNGDALRYEQVIGLYLLLTGGTMSGAIAMGANKITGLANGTASGDATAFNQVSGQRIIQSVQASSITPATSTSNTFTASNITASITPTSASSKIRITACFTASVNGSNQTMFTLFRGISGNLGDATNGMQQLTVAGSYPCTLISYDSPATTSATSYTVYYRTTAGNTAGVGTGGGTQIIILEEIG
jgi:hypothetical protein